MKKIIIFLSVIIMLISFFFALTCSQNSVKITEDPLAGNVFDDADEAKASGVIVEDAFEPDNTIETAGTILIEKSQYHSIFPAGDTDWFKFTLAEGLIYDISLYATTDVSMVLYDSNGNQLAAGVKELSYYKILWTCRNAGTYYIRAVEVNSAVIGNYTLLIKYSDVLPSYPDYYEPNDSMATAVVLGPLYKFNASIHNASDADYFKFTSYIGDYTICKFTANQSDINFSLYSNGGSTLVMNQVIPAGTSKNIEWGNNKADTICYVKVTSTSNFTPFNYYFEHLGYVSMYDPGEPNETFANATEVTFLTMYDCDLHNLSDVDFFKFYAEAGKSYEVQTLYYSDFEIKFTLYDKDQKTVLNQTDSPSTIVFNCKSTGWYYPCFSILNQNITYQPSYTLMVYSPDDL